MRLKSVSAIFFLASSLPLFSQVVPAATGSGLPQWSFGGGFSDFNLDLGRGQLLGSAAWVDYTLDGLPPRLRGICVELEARDLRWDRPPTERALLVDAAGGGAIYKWARFSNFRPYGKITAELANVDYLGIGIRRQRFHQSRTDTSIGGGFEIRVFRSVWARADYEYQYLPNFFISKRNLSVGAPLDPMGFTVGATYNIGNARGARRK
jgi:hypothetical protein